MSWWFLALFVLGVNGGMEMDFCGCNVVFVQAASGSWTQSDFLKAKEFAEAVVVNLRHQNTNRTVVEFALISFGFNAKLWTNLTASYPQAYSAINSMGRTTGITHTYLALDMADSVLVFNNVTESCNLVILVVDGRSSNPTRTLQAATQLKATGAYIYAVGIGPYVNKAELNALASGVKLLPSTQGLKGLAESLIPTCKCGL